MLEGVEVDVAVGERVVRGHVVRELHDLEVDALVGERGLRARPQVVIDAADHAELDGHGLAGLIVGVGIAVVGGVVCLGAAGGQREGERGGCKGEGKELFELHGNILR